MAKLLRTAHPDFPEVNWEGDWQTQIDEQYKRLQELCDKTADLPDGQIEGAIIHFPRGDGSAYYQVTREKPLTIQWIAVGDNWQVEGALIRGLRKADILRQIESEKFWKREAANNG